MKKRLSPLEIGTIVIVLGVLLTIVGVKIYQLTAGSQTPPIEGQNCGEISIRQAQGPHVGNYTGPFSGPTAANQGINCFWQAYTNCKPATIVYSQMGIDTHESNTFTVQSANGSCHLTVTTFAQINVSPPTKHGPIPCTRLVQAGDNLVAQGCGDEGDMTLFVPVSSGLQTPTPTPGTAS